MPSEKPKLNDVLLLLTIPNFGSGRIRRLFSVFESSEQIFKASSRKLMQVNGIDRKLIEQIKRGGNQREVDVQLELIKKHRINVLTIWDKKYPTLLRKTADPPLVLFYEGDLPESLPPCLAVVGTRTPTQYGKTVTEKLVGELIHNGIAIVSGLARGIDTVAHQAALNYGGKTIAVLGCGLDHIYPPENRKIYQSIQEKGVLFSEYFIGIGPDAVNFPRRNRIISGISLGVLIVEAGDKSGALITANYAVDQNREVFAVPGAINNPKSSGPHRLIQEGAKLVHTVQDILDEIAPGLAQGQPAEKPIPAHLSPLDRTVLENLSTDPKHIDRLVLEMKQTPAVILSSLLNLELSGLVRQLSGKMFIRL
jgi:DNA processing protein